MIEDRMPPNDKNAEMAMLGAILLNNDKIAACSAQLLPESFHTTPHQVIFAAICDMFDSGQKVDYVMLSDYLDSKGKLEEVGGAYYLTELAQKMPSAESAEYYAKIVYEKWALRQLIEIFQTGENRSFECDGAMEVVSSVHAEIMKLSRVYGKHKSFIRMESTLMSTFDHISAMRNDGKLVGISTGLKALDEFTCGLMKGEITFLSGQPSTGKTSLSLNIAVNAARDGFGVAVMSYEMSEFQISLRMLCTESGINVHKARAGKLTKEDFDTFSRSVGPLSNLQIFINDSNSVDMHDLRMQVYKLTKGGQIDMLIVDYLQLIPVRKRSNSRVSDISEISNNLKTIAKELNVHVLAVSSLSRAGELRESGQLDFDADNIWLLEKDNEDIRLIIKKQRNGPTGVVNVTFLKEITKFVDSDLQRTEPSFIEDEPLF